MPVAPETAVNRPRKRILVVDDDLVILKTVSTKLTAQGFEVLTAVDGSEAVSTARKEKPDLILLDISFPPDVGFGGGVPWDGFLIMSWIRRMDEAKHIPVIMIAGGDPVKLEKQSLSAGAVAFFGKPIDHDRLVEVIRRTLDGIEPSPTPTQGT